MQKIKADHAWKQKNMTFYLQQNTEKPLVHMHAISDSHCNVSRIAQDSNNIPKVCNLVFHIHANVSVLLTQINYWL